MYNQFSQGILIKLISMTQAGTILHCPYIWKLIFIWSSATVFLLTLQYPRKAETAFTGDLQTVKEGAKFYLSTGKHHLLCSARI